MTEFYKEEALLFMIVLHFSRSTRDVKRKQTVVYKK